MDTVYRFMFLARPQPGHPDYSQIAGAFVDAWIAQPDEPTAEHIARDALREEKWQVERLEEWSVASRQKYKYSTQSLKHFEDALQNGCSLKFYFLPEHDMDQRQAA